MAKFKRNFKTNARIPLVAMIFPLLIGAIFVCIGIFVVIPNLGVFGYFWTAISVVIMICPPIMMVVMNKKMAKGVNIETTVTHEDLTETVETKLAKIEKLYNDGVISKEEYEKARANVINNI